MTTAWTNDNPVHWHIYASTTIYIYMLWGMYIKKHILPAPTIVSLKYDYLLIFMKD